MRIHPALLLAVSAPFSVALASDPLPEPGIYTNEEAAYFIGDRGDEKPAWAGLKILADGRWQWVDEFGKPTGEWRSGAIPGMQQTSVGWSLNGAEMRRAAQFTCWMSVKKFAAKPDGADDYTFAGKLPLFDQGGRVQSGGGDSGAPAAIFRLRTVYWPAPSTNKPSLVLYVHRPEQPDHAVSYVWADPDAKLIGINLRWVQGSCTREEP